VKPPEQLQWKEVFRQKMDRSHGLLPDSPSGPAGVWLKADESALAHCYFCRSLGLAQLIINAIAIGGCELDYIPTMASLILSFGRLALPDCAAEGVHTDQSL
jgi:hypothetical protein